MKGPLEFTTLRRYIDLQIIKHTLFKLKLCQHPIIVNSLNSIGDILIRANNHVNPRQVNPRSAPPSAPANPVDRDPAPNCACEGARQLPAQPGRLDALRPWSDPAGPAVGRLVATGFADTAE